MCRGAADPPKKIYDHGIYLTGEPVEMPAPAAAGQLTLLTFPDELLRLDSPEYSVHLELFPLYISNGTKEAISLPSCDTWLYLVEEAKDADGKWRPIDPRPSSSCGNSYYNVTLPAESAWRLICFKHSGDFRTKLRFRLDGKTPIYSNEFEGTIDRDQFNLPMTWIEETRLLMQRSRAATAPAASPSPRPAAKKPRKPISATSR
ncbi:MAG: hypothetical protein QOE70_888 [Chthoniobacter sp.]|nr:hypothetical protein [Chthoniobacter sp.]